MKLTISHKSQAILLIIILIILSININMGCELCEIREFFYKFNLEGSLELTDDPNFINTPVTNPIVTNRPLDLLNV